MLYKWINFACAGFALVCTTLYGGTQTTDPESELIVVEQQIKELKKQLHQVHISETKEEVEGQGLAIADWEAFTADLGKVRRQNEQERQILDQLEKLELQRVELLKLTTPKKSF